MDPILRERLTLFGLGESELALVKKIGKMLDGHIDNVLQNFYDSAMQDPQAKAMFSSQAVIDHARAAQKKHWQMMLSGDFSDDYLKSCTIIGQTHLRIKLPFKLYLSSYARATSDLQAGLIKSIGRSAALNPSRLARMLGVLNRVCALDAELVINAYFVESQADELEASFNYIRKSVSELSVGNLQCQITPANAPDFPEKFDELRESWNSGIGAMASTIGAIDETVNNIRQTSVGLEEASAGLSTRAESQAASLEETTAAISVLSDSVSTTAENSGRMDTVTKQAKTDMESGSEAMVNAATAMNRISQASEEINQIISLIDDISFQTNLLALNAGVEAARAGEAGRGFAVVASEVRNLAASSSGAAQQIKQLIGRSTQEVGEGVKLVGAANDILAKVVERFDEVAELTSTVSAAASDQSSSLREVSGAVAEMDQITQKNAAMANDTTMQLRDLVKIAEDLTQQLTHFQLDNSNQAGRTSMAA